MIVEMGAYVGWKERSRFEVTGGREAMARSFVMCSAMTHYVYDKVTNLMQAGTIIEAMIIDKIGTWKNFITRQEDAALQTSTIIYFNFLTIPSTRPQRRYYIVLLSSINQSTLLPCDPANRKVDRFSLVPQQHDHPYAY